MSGSPATRDARPARGTRPANRRALILDAATELFARDGYANVAMSDIAEAVAVGPSALYRHFRGKRQLLEAVITDSLDAADRLLDETESGARPLASDLAAAAIAQRHVGVLWRREARQLPPDTRTALHHRMRGFRRRVADQIAAQRPDLGAEATVLLATCAVAVATSVSFHNVTLPEPEFSTLLGTLIETVVHAPVPALRTGTSGAAPEAPLRPGTRREQLLAAAIDLFARDGYAHVGMEDIGTVVGIAGPSVYHHFARKEDVLAAALTRGAEWLRIDMNRALAAARDDTDAVRALIASYLAFAFDNPGLVQVLLTEVIHLPEPHRQQIRAVQLDYVFDWVRTVRAVHPEWSAPAARLRVQAVLGMLNDIAQTRLPVRYTTVRQASALVAEELLALGATVGTLSQA
ncbi:TetR/AcrR family transcriptional regulator [Nocardia puris]|uniref:TetR/AcrR family transcriptional regulator n=1 Tax=Nocardia puris TaxID=208602 RepID=UPI00082ED866|nr:TetR/AcrR family transcriptional regulator [Nocardia puris]MBF6212667.1 TetR/AcrR family transcriptional regulator [Nocardia puris]MBF6367605.1 TetR/AcrR family transcriptional regulator [Nocardia puris]MBF6461256.1 TetR/AcrR family transcriptional regulator [Nocardia puris]